MLPFQEKPKKKLTYKEKVLSGQIKSGLPKFSKKGKEKHNKYIASIKTDSEIQYCAKCGRQSTKSELERHHYKGQKFVTEYIYLCSQFGCGWHEWIHKNPDEAMNLGWLWPEYRNKIPNINQLIPWK